MFESLSLLLDMIEDSQVTYLGILQTPRALRLVLWYFRIMLPLFRLSLLPQISNVLKSYYY
jgi:hypothetical protein